MTVSVAMAAYNGEQYISEQIDSILPQLRDGDELIISLNPSSDHTETILRSYEERDARVHVALCTQKGVLSNFENAISLCNNDIIFLADQDDIWVKGKISRQLSLFENHSIGGVCHGCRYIDANGKLMDTQPAIHKTRYIRPYEIIWKNPVQGSCLAFRRELRNQFLPFPKDIPMHDSWIGLCICRKSKLLFISNLLLLYRQHTNSVTTRKHKRISLMMSDRIKLVKNMSMIK